MRWGVCYYPEQWPEERWQLDAASMADHGLSLVRIGEFAWSSIEPQRGAYRWGWLDRAIDTLQSAGLDVVLGTPTATPPVWLMEERPEILSVGPDGRARPYGSRRHTCVTSPAYREESARIVDALVVRYGSHPAVVGWQVDNEVGNHDSARCWCGSCQTAFTAWLEGRYLDIDRLNAAWGTAFWSQTYPSFASVRLPAPTMTSHHPALRLNHLRFASEQAVQFIEDQARMIRRGVPPAVSVTTNFYNEDIAVDQRQAAALCDIASIDNYPHGPADAMATAFHLDLAHGMAPAAWIMEQQAGPINWTEINPPVPDGQVRVWMWQAALHGYDAMLFFRWRAARSGQEMYHSGLLRHDGTPTRALAEIRSTIDEISAADLTRPAPSIALLHSYEDAWAIDVNPHRAGLTHRGLQLGAYVAARRLGFDVAIVDPDSDLTGFELVLAPALHIMTPSRVEALATALDAGTTVVLGPRSLVIDPDANWIEAPSPGGMTGRLGARVVDSLSQAASIKVNPWGTGSGIWTDVLDVEDATVLATYGGDSAVPGAPAFVGRGGLYYAGFTAGGSWTRVLQMLTGQDRSPRHLETFDRAGVRYRINHRTLAVDRGI